MDKIIPSNISAFYSDFTDKSKLFQGDIIRSDGIGLKQDGDSYSPDYWMIITKDCDLVLSETGLPRKQNISLLPLFAIKILESLYYRDLRNSLSRLRNRIVIMAIWNFSKAFGKISRSHIDNLVRDKISKFMFLPPEGKIFNEPMIIDFDLVMQLDGSSKDEVEKVIASKVLQLVSPYRERISQRFAEHYSSIGIDDEEIRNKAYVKAIKQYVPTK